MRKRLEYAYDRATQQADRNRDRSKARYDANVTESFLNKGDRVLVRNVSIRGKEKNSLIDGLRKYILYKINWILTYQCTRYIGRGINGN